MNIKSKAVLAYVVIFLLGGASGFFLNEAINPGFPVEEIERGPGMNREFPAFGEGKVPQRMKNYITERLDLREDQVEPFFEVQSEHLQTLFNRMKEHREDEMEMLQSLYFDFVNDVDEILTDQQLRELNSFAHPDSVHHRRMQHRDRWRKNK